MTWYAESDTELNLSESVSRVENNKTILPLCDWTVLKDKGLISSREEYIERVREISFAMAEAGIAESLSKKDVEMLQMVQTLDEIDNVINLLTERAVEWHSSITPEFSKKYSRFNSAKLLHKLSNSENFSMKRVAREIISLTDVRTTLMKDVSKKADAVIPNMSALVGGLVAARLVLRAGGLDEISKMAGSSIQVIGAESALFSHIRTGSSSPKHGIIFQHRRVHNAPKENRGRTARVLASKLAIAARLDLYRGELDAEFIADADKKINAAMGETK
ncbi:MAG: RNA-processing protein [Methanocorpusculum sp.]|nr:RNA-processing protein [Methanocorpusculum sp.]